MKQVSSTVHDVIVSTLSSPPSLRPFSLNRNNLLASRRGSHLVMKLLIPPLMAAPLTGSLMHLLENRECEVQLCVLHPALSPPRFAPGELEFLPAVKPAYWLCTTNGLSAHSVHSYNPKAKELLGASGETQGT